MGGSSIVQCLLGSVMVWFGRCAFVKKLTDALVGLRFVTVIGLAIVAEPKIPEMLKGMFSMVPEGGDLCILDCDDHPATEKLTASASLAACAT